MAVELDLETRFQGLDVLRGLAIVLMVLDHLLVVLDGPGWSAGRILTRASMPLFAVVLGTLATKPLRWRRRAQWTGALLAALCLYPIAGIGGPLLMLWLGLGRAACQVHPRWRPLLLIAALTLMANHLATAVMPGEYDPGAIVGLVLAGRMIGATTVASWAARLPPRLAHIGRRPLLWYVGHLAVLAVVVPLH